MVQTGAKHVPSIKKHRNYLNLIVQVLIKNLYFISSNLSDKMIVLIYFEHFKILKCCLHIIT